MTRLGLILTHVPYDLSLRQVVEKYVHKHFFSLGTPGDLQP